MGHAPQGAVQWAAQCRPAVKGPTFLPSPNPFAPRLQAHKSGLLMSGASDHGTHTQQGCESHREAPVPAHSRTFTWTIDASEGGPRGQPSKPCHVLPQFPPWRFAQAGSEKPCVHAKPQEKGTFRVSSHEPDRMCPFPTTGNMLLRDPCPQQQSTSGCTRCQGTHAAPGNAWSLCTPSGSQRAVAYAHLPCTPPRDQQPLSAPHAPHRAWWPLPTHLCPQTPAAPACPALSPPEPGGPHLLPHITPATPRTWRPLPTSTQAPSSPPPATYTLPVLQCSRVTSTLPKVFLSLLLPSVVC